MMPRPPGAAREVVELGAALGRVLAHAPEAPVEVVRDQKDVHLGRERVRGGAVGADWEHVVARFRERGLPF